MPQQIYLLSKAQTTRFAVVWFFSRVDTEVSLQTTLLGKRFKTDVTFKRSLFSMCTNVLRQGLLLVEDSKTNCALEGVSFKFIFAWFGSGLLLQII